MFQLELLGKSKNVDVPVYTTTKTDFQFSDSEFMLDQVLLQGIFIHYFANKTMELRSILPWADLRSCYLSLLGYQNEVYNHKISLRAFQTSKYVTGLGVGVGEGFDIAFIKPKLVNIRNSYITVPGAPTLVIPANGYSVAMTLFYENYNPAIHKLNDRGELIES